MDALKNDADFDLVFDGKVYDTVKAKELWDLSKALIEKIKGEDILINL